MVTNKLSRHEASVHKHVKLKAHHAKPYRKRHVGLLFVSIVALVLLGLALVQYRDQIISGFASSRSFVGDLFVQNKAYDVNVMSSYGFHVTYDQKAFYASAVSNDNGDLYLGSELGQRHAYNIVRIAPNFSDSTGNATTPSALTMTYHPDHDQANAVSELVALKDGGIDSAKVSRVSTILTGIGGQVFKKTTWQSKETSAITPSLSAKFVTYSGTVRDDLVTIAITLGVSGVNESVYAPILNSISFDNKISFVATPTHDVIAKVQATRSVLDTVMGTNIAAAAANGVDLTGSEKVAALYSPAVVKIYNAYCMDISIDGTAYLNNICGAASGSGFFVSQDGYLGTNGHVASTQPLDLIISDAISYYSTKGDPQYFNYLLKLSGLKEADIPASSTDAQTLGIMIDAMYKIDASRITATKEVKNLLVQVTPKNPDVTALLQDTKDRKTYTGDSSVLTAKLVAADYRANDGYDGFKSSDVAIIKVEGSNFPIMKLGSIDSVTQGSGLSILGYPGNASDNGVVDSTSSEATLTTGKVSSKKSASGSDKKLIETDTTIGHGNSGGPALDDMGGVIGIATYTADGSGDGNGIFNYIRDIKDLTDLASSSHITFDTTSATQTAWEKGISEFYTSHYSKAVKSFQVVQTLYPNDSRVAEFIAASEKRIANGEDVVDFPLVTVLIVAGVILLGAGVAVILIVRHHKKHMIYTAGVAQGSVQPAGPGVATQRVIVSQNGPTVGVPLVSNPAAPVTAPESVPGLQQVATVPLDVPLAPVLPTPEPIIEAPLGGGSGYGESTYNPTPPVAEAPSTTEPTEEPPIAANAWFSPDTPPDDQPKA